MVKRKGKPMWVDEEFHKFISEISKEEDLPPRKVTKEILKRIRL